VAELGAVFGAREAAICAGAGVAAALLHIDPGLSDDQVGAVNPISMGPPASGTAATRWSPVCDCCFFWGGG
jgi:hypothetical protein